MEHEHPQGWGQWKQNSWIQHGTTYGHYSGVGSSGEESSILTLLENMHVEQRERHEKESRSHDAFEDAQEERFRVVHEHMTAQDNNFNNFATYATKQFNENFQNMAFNPSATQTGINDMIRYQNDNHHHSQLFYRETCDFLDYEYGGEGLAWY